MMSDEYTIAKYLRLSLEDGDLDEAKDESNSISNQRKLLDYYIEQHPDLSGAKILEFVDDGYSGTSFDRPGVQKLLQMVKENKISCIMIKDFSRWGRDYIMVSDYLEQIFPFLQVRVISVNDNYDSATITSTAGNIEVGFTNIMHDMYSKDLSRKLLVSKRQLFEAGKYHSSYPFYGYLKSTTEKYHLEIEPEAAGVVKKIFRWYAAGSSTKEIAQKLNRTDTMTPLLWLVKFCGFKPRFEKGSTKGTRWTSSSVMHILKDERYTGKCIYGKTKVAKIGSRKLIKQPESEWFVVPNRFPVIITQALFDKTAAIRKSRARTKVKKGEPSPRIFLGNIRCGHCGYAMNFHETKYPYYICHARQADNDLHCQGTRIMESDLAEVVLNALKQFAQVCLDSERRLEKRREVMRSERAQIQEKIKQQEKIAAKLLLKGNDCFEELLEGKIDDQEYTIRMAENNRKVAECQKQVDALNEALQSMPEVPNAMSEKTLIGKILSLERLDRKLADLTVKCIHVFKDGSLQIEWNFSGLFDSMFPQDLLEVLPRTETVMLNRTWIYCCTVDGWDELERMRQELFAYAEGRQWLVVGDSFDNSKPCLEANGFRQMRDAAKQGRVDNVLVYTLDGLSKRSKNYARFQRQIEKRHVLMYDRNGNLLIGA